MEIIYLTDIHDDLKKLRYVIQNTNADLYIISGDLIYKAFYTEDKLYHFLELQDSFYREINRLGLPLLPYEYAMQILSSPEKHEPAWALNAAEYRILFQQAATNMKEKYQTIRELIDKYARAATMVIPGNYDMDLQYTALAEYDLHKKHLVMDGISFAGYGGAPIVTPGIPELLSVVFQEVKENGTVESEPKVFFEQTRPDVLIIHNPAYGTLDRLPSYGHCGSFGIRDYIDDHQPALVLSGHVHEDFGLMKINQTWCLNPSNFGGVQTPAGEEPGGNFCRIVLNRDGERTFLRQVQLLQVLESGGSQSERFIRSILEIRLDKNLRASEHVIDEQEYVKTGPFLR